jgi:hypothetical protein
MVDTCIYITFLGVSAFLNANNDTMSKVNRLEIKTDLVCIGVRY